jgi:hypothetical protein
MANWAFWQSFFPICRKKLEKKAKQRQKYKLRVEFREYQVHCFLGKEIP